MKFQGEKFMQQRFVKKSVISVCAILMFAANSVSAQTIWTAFWTKFKTAVAKNDKQAVSSLSKNKLSDVDYKELFGTRARQTCFAKAKPVKDEQAGYSIFCGEQGYYFQKVGSQFKFIEGFANG